MTWEERFGWGFFVANVVCVLLNLYLLVATGSVFSGALMFLNIAVSVIIFKQIMTLRRMTRF